MGQRQDPKRSLGPLTYSVQACGNLTDASAHSCFTCLMKSGLPKTTLYVAINYAVTNYSKIWQLKTGNIGYHEVPEGQETGCILVGIQVSSSLVQTGLGCQLGLQSSRGSTGEDLCPSSCTWMLTKFRVSQTISQRHQFLDKMRAPSMVPGFLQGVVGERPGQASRQK